MVSLLYSYGVELVLDTQYTTCIVKSLFTETTRTSSAQKDGKARSSTISAGGLCRSMADLGPVSAVSSLFSPAWLHALDS